MPTPPSITSITFDKAQYLPGTAINATVTYVPGTSGETQTFNGVAMDSATGESGNLSVQFTLVVNDTTTITATDSGGRAWNKISDTGTVAVFQAIA